MPSRIGSAVLLAASASSVIAGDRPAALQFAWPLPTTGTVTVLDERALGDELRSVALETVLHADRGPMDDRIVVRFDRSRIVAVDGVPLDRADTGSIAYAVAHVMQHLLPTMVVGVDGTFIESIELRRVARELGETAGVPLPIDFGAAIEGLLTDIARSEWEAWVGVWRGLQLSPGDWVRDTGEFELDGVLIPVTITRKALGPGEREGSVRYELTTSYPAESVRHYTSGFLIDMARAANELDDRSVSSRRLLDGARFSAVREKIVVDLEPETMRPLALERVRTFEAVAGKHRVEGKERRHYRIDWHAPSPR